MNQLASGAVDEYTVMVEGETRHGIYDCMLSHIHDDEDFLTEQDHVVKDRFRSDCSVLELVGYCQRI
jgi:hypothetical protein